MPIKARRKRAPNLNDEGIERIVLLLDDWKQPKLTWDHLIAHIRKHFNVTYTRQALDRHARISDAFAARKKALTTTENASNALLTPEMERISALEAKVERLERENNNLLEQFNRWIYHGRRLNASLMEEDWRALRDELSQPLPTVDRRASKEDPAIIPKRPSRSK